jgi:hypothetical protein
MFDHMKGTMKGTATDKSRKKGWGSETGVAAVSVAKAGRELGNSISIRVWDNSEIASRCREAV